jgi:hypothetical protein
MDLGIDGLTPLAISTKSGQPWARALSKRPWLRSEGVRTTLGPPQVIDRETLSRWSELIQGFDAFYRRSVRAYYDDPRRRQDFALNESFRAWIDRDRDVATPLPLSRFDCVMLADRSLRFIELNANGVCVSHLSNVSYLARELMRQGAESGARAIESLVGDMVASFDRLYREQCTDPRPDPTMGALMPGRRWLYGTNLLFRDAFARRGWGYQFGATEDLEITRTEVRLAGKRIDLLWADFLFYFAYQFTRYQQTKWPTKIGAYDDTPQRALAMLEDPSFAELIGTRKLALASPMASYLALSKHLLSWIARPDPVLFPSEVERQKLERASARTYARADRMRGALSFDDARLQKNGLLMKPCLYGGAHGVEAGSELSDEAWVRKLETIWEDEQWVLQEMFLPLRTAQGEWVSVGLYNYGGRLGGITVRTSPRLIVSARESSFIPVVAEGT